MSVARGRLVYSNTLVPSICTLDYAGPSSSAQQARLSKQAPRSSPYRSACRAVAVQRRCSGAAVQAGTGAQGHKGTGAQGHRGTSAGGEDEAPRPAGEVAVRRPGIGLGTCVPAGKAEPSPTHRTVASPAEEWAPGPGPGSWGLPAEGTSRRAYPEGHMRPDTAD